MKPEDTIGAIRPRRSPAERDSDERLFQVPGTGWYILTREGLEGPFDDQDQAELRLESLIARRIPVPPFIDTVELQE